MNTWMELYFMVSFFGKAIGIVIGLAAVVSLAYIHIKYGDSKK